MVDFTQGVWQITDNAEWQQPLIFSDDNGTPYNLSGSTFRLDLATARGVTAVLSMTTANSKILSTDLTNGTITLKMSAGDIAPGSYLGELLRVTGGIREFLLLVVVEVADGIT